MKRPSAKDQGPKKPRKPGTGRARAVAGADIAVEVRRAREAWEDRKITMAQLALESGIPLATISQIFTGKNKNPSLERVSKLLHAVGLRLSVEPLNPPEPGGETA